MRELCILSARTFLLLLDPPHHFIVLPHSPTAPPERYLERMGRIGEWCVTGRCARTTCMYNLLRTETVIKTNKDRNKKPVYPESIVPFRLCLPVYGYHGIMNSKSQCGRTAKGLSLPRGKQWPRRDCRKARAGEGLYEHLKTWNTNNAVRFRGR